LKREIYIDGAELINTKEQFAIAPFTTPVQEVAQGRELVLAGSSYSQRIFHLPVDGFIPIYLWDLMTFTANSFPEFYSYVPSRESGLGHKMVLLVPVGISGVSYSVEARACRTSSSTSPTFPQVAIKPFDKAVSLDALFQSFSKAWDYLSKKEKDICERRGLTPRPPSHVPGQS
jgi:hypothetical protein